MIRKTFFIFIILLFLPVIVFSFGNKEKENFSPDKETLLKILEKYEKQWEKQGIKNYTEEITYIRASFPPEQFIITVSDNIIQNWTEDSGDKTFSEDFIKSLTVENMFDKVRKSINSEKQSPFGFIVSYNEEFGYITELSYLPANNKENSGSRPPFDRNYHIEVVLLDLTKKDIE